MKLSKKDLVHNEEWVLKWMYIGLRESELPGQVIKNLTEKELAAYTLGVYLNKYKERRVLPLENLAYPLYNMVSEYIGLGMPIVNNRDVIKNGNGSNGKPLKERLDSVPENILADMRSALCQDGREYVSEGQYHYKKRERDGDNQGLEIMDFLPVYMNDRHGNRRDLRPKYASEICKIIKNKGDLDGAKSVQKKD